jgi:glutathione S-transferase
MYRLYWSPRRASMPVHAALEELAVDYALERVDLSRPREPTFLKLNPTGRVPTLAVSDGVVIAETAAILMYLADRHPQAALAPLGNDPLRPAYYQWTCYLSSTLQPACFPWFYPERYSDDPSHFEAIKKKAQETLYGIWQHIDRHLEQGGPHILGLRFTTCDLLLHMCSEWRRPHPDLLQRYRCVGRLVKLVSERPSVQRMMAYQEPA